MKKRKVNPVHFRPMWTLQRLGHIHDLDDTIDFSDAELLAIQIVLEAFQALDDGNERSKLMKNMIEHSYVVVKKLKKILREEFKEDDERYDD